MHLTGQGGFHFLNHFRKQNVRGTRIPYMDTQNNGLEEAVL